MLPTLDLILGVWSACFGQANVSVFFSAQVDTVHKTATTITDITLVDGRTFTAARWIDASYEGDLFARAGSGCAACVSTCSMSVCEQYMCYNQDMS